MSNLKVKINQEFDLGFDTEEIQKRLKERAKQEVNIHLNDIFISKKEKDKIIGYRNTTINSHVGYDLIEESISKNLLDSSFEAYIKSYIDRHFQKYLDEALMLALRHKAKQIAFQQTGVQLPRERCDELAKIHLEQQNDIANT